MLFLFIVLIDTKTKSILFGKSTDHYHYYHEGQHQHSSPAHAHELSNVSASHDPNSGINTPTSARSQERQHGQQHGGPMEAEAEAEEEYISLKYRLNSAVILAAVAGVSLNNSRTSQDSAQPLIGSAEQKNPLVATASASKTPLSADSEAGASAAESKAGEERANRVIVDYDRLAKQHSELRHYEEHVKEHSGCCAGCACCCCCYRAKLSTGHFSSAVANLAESISFNNIYLFKRPVLYFRCGVLISMAFDSTLH